jgi:hypothetical protein
LEKSVAKREPKSQQTTTIQVIGRPGERKGWLELTTGSVTYYRPSAKTETLRLTYQQLLALFEKEVEYREINEKSFKLPREHQEGDFVLGVYEIEEDESEYPFVVSTTVIRKLDPRRIDDGTYQFSDDMANGKKPKKSRWFARVSIQVALWIIHRYIEKFLAPIKSKTRTDLDVQISKQEMSDILLSFYKRINS